MIWTWLVFSRIFMPSFWIFWISNLTKFIQNKKIWDNGRHDDNFSILLKINNHLSLWPRNSTILGITPAWMMSSMGGFRSLERSFLAACVHCIWVWGDVLFMPAMISTSVNPGPFKHKKRIVKKQMLYLFFFMTKKKYSLVSQVKKTTKCVGQVYHFYCKICKGE